MKYNASYHGFVRQFGIDEIFTVQTGRFTSNTIIATRGNQKISVSDILKTAGYLIDFIKATYDVSEKKYSEALLFLKTVNLVFNNQQQRKPTKERMHYAVDVFHEIADRQSRGLEERQANARLALTLNAMIDMFGEKEKT